MMDDLLVPLDGHGLRPGDLVRTAPAAIGDQAGVPEPAGGNHGGACPPGPGRGRRRGHPDAAASPGGGTQRADGRGGGGRRGRRGGAGLRAPARPGAARPGDAPDGRARGTAPDPGSSSRCPGGRAVRVQPGQRWPTRHSRPAPTTTSSRAGRCASCSTSPSPCSRLLPERRLARVLVLRLLGPSPEFGLQPGPPDAHAAQVRSGP